MNINCYFSAFWTPSFYLCIYQLWASIIIWSLSCRPFVCALPSFLKAWVWRFIRHHLWFLEPISTVHLQSWSTVTILMSMLNFTSGKISLKPLKHLILTGKKRTSGSLEGLLVYPKAERDNSFPWIENTMKWRQLHLNSSWGGRVYVYQLHGRHIWDLSVNLKVTTPPCLLFYGCA